MENAVILILMEVAIILLVIGGAVILFAGGGDAIGELMGNLSPSEIAGYAQGAGFSGSDLVMAVSVALAESSGNPGAVGDTAITPGGSIGLWQINLRWHPEFNGQDLTDPQTNANAAYSIYRAAGNSFSPWSTYGNGMASSQFSRASAGVTEMQGTAGDIESA